MKVLPFVPNYLRNKGKTFDKHKNGAETRPEPKKKTVIPNAIKEAGEGEPRIAEIKRKRGRPAGSKNKKTQNETNHD